MLEALKLLKEKFNAFIPAFLIILICSFLLIFWNFYLKNKFSISFIKISQLEKKLKEEKDLNNNLKIEKRQWEDVILKIKKFEEKLGTKKENLGNIINEIEELSKRCGFVPHSYAFTYQEKERKNFVEFKISFPFEGDYASVRNFLNLIEMADMFLTLDSINLRTSGELSEKVSLQFQISTYFKGEY